MDEESRADCVFCEIVAGRAPALRIDENEDALAILDTQPFSEGHALVLSKRHVPWWHDLTEKEAADVFALAHRLARRGSPSSARARRLARTLNRILSRSETGPRWAGGASTSTV